MKIQKYIFILVLFIVNISVVDALSYDVDTKLVKVSNDLAEVRLSLKNVKDTNYGVAACLFELELNEGVKLNGEIRTLNNWNMIKGEFYLFDTGNPILSEGEFAIIPIKFNGNGEVILHNIECSDGDSSTKIADKAVNVTFNSSVNNNNNNNNNDDDDNKVDNDKDIIDNVDEVKDSNCDLSNIILSDGEIDFNSSVTEYQLEVTDFEKLEIKPILSSDKAQFDISKNDNEVVIKVIAEDGSNKTYTIYVDEIDSLDEEDKKDNSLVPIFVLIICALVLINLIRVAVKFIKKK